MNDQVTEPTDAEIDAKVDADMDQGAKLWNQSMSRFMALLPKEHESRFAFYCGFYASFMGAASADIGVDYVCQMIDELRQEMPLAVSKLKGEAANAKPN